MKEGASCASATSSSLVPRVLEGLREIRRRLRGGRVASVLVLTGLLVAAPVPWPVRPVFGATIVVTTTADEAGTNPAACSLREAIIAANRDAAFGGCPAGSGADTIVLQSGQTYTLTIDNAPGDEDEAAEDDLDIESTITIEGNGATIQRDPALTCDLSNTNEKGEFRIFHIDYRGDLTLQNVTVRRGCADPGDGGGIRNSGTVTITGSTLSGNSAEFLGGGIRNSGTVTITNSTISGNSADGGGAIYNEGGRVNLTNVTISGNRGSEKHRSLLLVSGIGGILNGLGTVNASFVTIVNNTGSSRGAGGIFNLEYGGSVGPFRIKNSIVGENTADGAPNCSGRLISVGTNLATDDTCRGFTQVPSTGARGLNLGPLANNGGPTQTHALLTGSAAIDAADDCTDLFDNMITTDQRGVARPQGSACDAGAFEAQGAGEPGPTVTVIKDDEDGAICLELRSDHTYAFYTPAGVFSGSVTTQQVGARTIFQNVGGDPLLGMILADCQGLRTGVVKLKGLSLGQIFPIVDADLADNPPRCR